MLKISETGLVMHEKVKMKIISKIEIKEMKQVSGIIVHQTGGSTAEGTINQYQSEFNKNKIGAHFLIDKDGTIYQTASIYKMTNNVGPLKSRCLAEHTCKPADLKKLKSAKVKAKGWARAVHNIEKKKNNSDRYPLNEDSIGIELVGRAFPSKDPKIKEPIYEKVTDEQNAALKWLVNELITTTRLSMKNVYRHPIVSEKNKTEAATAKW